ncbi:MAG: flagellar basal body-associated FliL family protein [Proteobacteria bacterium]|nr:flagellar basal body-associated FliL family protein [Pseudomonadota bacterium]
MAEVPVLNAADGAAAAPKKGKKWLIIGIAAFVVLAGGGAAAFFALGHSDPHKKVEAKKEPAKPPMYVALDPPFVVNFQGDQLVRFLQVTVQVLTREPETAELLKANDPVVRNDLLMLFGNQKYEVVAQNDGKEKLRMDALKAVRHIVEANGGKPASIENVYFTSFVMQ